MAASVTYPPDLVRIHRAAQVFSSNALSEHCFLRGHIYLMLFMQYMQG